ncbi:cardiolipin synthase [Leptolyngbya iicbica]|uniref:Cardiolipin synthase n=2 Tax=Cyanophyceae TaxID=3028117 RepID=A0A4Q7E7Q6_9CYAN|nr:cardiolipin synthase [Leptolyngbya sp. LK]RZM76655.1 cardiolipin synthase [Leptolyngbya sp. LK]
MQLTALISLLVLFVQLLGVLNAAHAVMNVRSSQSAIAWSIALITFPWVAMPLYWILGRTRFRGYPEAIRRASAEYQAKLPYIRQNLEPYIQPLPPSVKSLKRLISNLARVPFTSHNQAQLLVNGEATFAALLAAIETAQTYILFQFYIIKDDDIGRELMAALIAKAQQGVRVYLSYDEIGSHQLKRSTLQRLRQSGIEVTAFRSTRGIRNRFQLNFRNHRKIVVVDGRIGFVGGLNVGDEYLGRDRRFGYWRDTHLSLQGPAVQCLQISFLQDWYWATRTIPEVNWQVTPAPDAAESLLVLPSGPADPFQTCTLFFNSAFQLAQRRLWIASPYFVPDETTLATLKMAALRGVDVRIMLPAHPDHQIVYLCSFSYYKELKQAGIQIYRFRKGFMHQKVVLVDDLLAGVGTTNLDNRSFHLNFEVMAFALQGPLLAEVEAMLLNDFENSDQVDLGEYDRRSLGFRLAVRAARLMAPLQ